VLVRTVGRDWGWVRLGGWVGLADVNGPAGANSGQVSARPGPRLEPTWVVESLAAWSNGLAWLRPSNGSVPPGELRLRGQQSLLPLPTLGSQWISLQTIYWKEVGTRARKDVRNPCLAGTKPFVCPISLTTNMMRLSVYFNTRWNDDDTRLKRPEQV